MHQLLSLKTKIFLIILIAAVVSGVASWIDLSPIGIGAIVGFVELVVLFLLFYSWKWIVNLPLVPRPAWMSVDLTGEWAGNIVSRWDDGAGNQNDLPIPVTLDLRQGWQEIAFLMETEKMRSRSMGAVPIFDRPGKTLQFRYFYETQPTAAASSTNPPQRLGTAIASFKIDRPKEIQIVYTNERGAGGDIRLSRRSRRRTI